MIGIQNKKIGEVFPYNAFSNEYYKEKIEPFLKTDKVQSEKKDKKSMNS
jgi:hypothetical protein